MQWNGIGNNDDNKDIAHLQGFIENVSYEDVFSDYSNQNFTVLSAVPSRTNSKSSYDDEEVWAILVTPKPITVKDTNQSSKVKKLKKEGKSLETRYIGSRPGHGRSRWRRMNGIAE